jgi:putative transposase
MKSITTKHDSSQPVADTAVYLFDDWFDPIEDAVRDRVRGFIQAMIEGELDGTLDRARYARRSKSSDGDDGRGRGHRSPARASVTVADGTPSVASRSRCRARLNGADGKTREWNSQMLRAYQRRTLAADALIASTYLAGTNSRRVRRALKALFGDAVGKGEK